VSAPQHQFRDVYLAHFDFVWRALRRLGVREQEAQDMTQKRLDAEASLVAAVRHELQSGKPRAALATLAQLQSQLPNGQLRQEREVLLVEALAASGNTAAAKSKASAFIAAHPASPLSAKLARVIEAQ
jgi:outer membrane protein assembly factor BamD (BamD/ComL family)